MVTIIRLRRREAFGKQVAQAMAVVFAFEFLFACLMALALQ